MAEHSTHEEKLQVLLDQMIQENSTDSEAAEHIKSIVREVQARSSDVPVSDEDQQDDDKDDLLSLIDHIIKVLSGLVHHNEYPYARIAVEEINSIFNILYPEEPNEGEEEGEEY